MPTAVASRPIEMTAEPFDGGELRGLAEDRVAALLAVGAPLARSGGSVSAMVVSVIVLQVSTTVRTYDRTNDRTN